MILRIIGLVGWSTTYETPGAAGMGSNVGAAIRLAVVMQRVAQKNDLRVVFKTNAVQLIKRGP